MSYTVHYAGDTATKHAKALEDTKEYLGADRFRQITDLMVASHEGEQTLVQIVSFAGVRGLPAVAWAEHIMDLRKEEALV